MPMKIFSDGPEEQVILTGMAALMLHAIVSGTPRDSRGSLLLEGSNEVKLAFDIAEAFMVEAKERAK